MGIYTNTDTAIALSSRLSKVEFSFSVLVSDYSCEGKVPPVICNASTYFTIGSFMLAYRLVRSGHVLVSRQRDWVLNIPSNASAKMSDSSFAGGRIREEEDYVAKYLKQLRDRPKY